MNITLVNKYYWALFYVRLPVVLGIQSQLRGGFPHRESHYLEGKDGLQKRRLGQVFFEELSYRNLWTTLGFKKNTVGDLLLVPVGE